MDRVLVVGSGGREHAIAWKLAQSPHVEMVYCAPGNGGTAVGEKCSNVDLKSHDDFVKFAKENGISLTVVGPEAPLVEGLADRFLESGLKIFGPTAAAAQLEGSKAYAKAFMTERGVPTAQFGIFTDSEAALEYALSRLPVFVKASGLAAGKGALPGRTQDETREAIRRTMLNKEFGNAGEEVVIEAELTGEEASYMALINSDADLCVPLLPSQDHKRLGDGDSGPNTGGMGAYAPTSLISKQLADSIDVDILSRTLEGLREKKLPYKGAIYPGLMISKGKPFVLEYNVRFGDPETQPVLSLLDSDFYEALMNVVDGKKPELNWKPGYSMCVVAVSGGYPGKYEGYPGKYEKGKEITGLNEEGQLDGFENVTIYHAGTKFENGKFYTSGGRVLGVTAVGGTIKQAMSCAYDAMDRIHFDRMFFRTDIGRRELDRVA